MEVMDFMYTRMIPFVMILVMFGLGLTLTIADFRRVLVFPRAVAVGLATQLILLPAVAFLLGGLLAPSPAIAAGAVIVAACPSGVLSNACTFAARADVALCVTLSAVTSVITVFTIPFLTYLALQAFFDQGMVPNLPVGGMLRTLITVTIVPVAAGMIVRVLWPGMAGTLLAPLRPITLLLLILIMVGAALSSWEVLRDNYAAAGLLVVSMNLLTMGMGFGIAKVFGLPPAQVVTITFEVGFQNLALALLITISVLGNSDLAIVALVYAVIMPATGLAFVPIGRRIVIAEEARIATLRTQTNELGRVVKQSGS